MSLSICTVGKLQVALLWEAQCDVQISGIWLGVCLAFLGIDRLDLEACRKFLRLARVLRGSLAGGWSRGTPTLMQWEICYDAIMKRQTRNGNVRIFHYMYVLMILNQICNLKVVVNFVRF